MTDKEALLELLKRFGLTPKVEAWTPPAHYPENTPPSEMVTLMAKEGGVSGYNGFFASFDFTLDGKFNAVEIGE